MESTEKTTVKTENKKDNKKEVEMENKETAKKEKEAKAVEAEVAEDEETEEDEGPVDLDNLFKRRESVRLTKDNAWFTRSEGGLISLRLINAEGNEENFEHVTLIRSFPITAPSEFISVREAVTKKSGRGAELGMIYNLADLDDATIELINDELKVRYFVPEVSRIVSTRKKSGYQFWELDTTAGRVKVILNSMYHNLRLMEDGSVRIYDMDGRAFVIPDPKKLDRQSYKVLAVYLF